MGRRGGFQGTVWRLDKKGDVVRDGGGRGRDNRGGGGGVRNGRRGEDEISGETAG